MGVGDTESARALQFAVVGRVALAQVVPNLRDHGSGTVKGQRLVV